MDDTYVFLDLPLKTWIGYLAAFMTTFSFVPQALMTWRTRSVEGISLGMYSVFTIGIFLWLIYGLLIGDMPVVIANCITLLLAGFILGLKIYCTLISCWSKNNIENLK